MRSPLSEGEGLARGGDGTETREQQQPPDAWEGRSGVMRWVRARCAWAPWHSPRTVVSTVKSYSTTYSISGGGGDERAELRGVVGVDGGEGVAGGFAEPDGGESVREFGARARAGRRAVLGSAITIIISKAVGKSLISKIQIARN